MLNRNLQQIVNQTMAATQQLSPPDDHVHKHDGVWWYWDVWRKARWGPFATEAKAREQFTAHQMKQGVEDAVPRVPQGEMDVR